MTNLLDLCVQIVEKKKYLDVQDAEYLVIPMYVKNVVFKDLRW